jgi:hypothetical protein
LVSQNLKVLLRHFYLNSFFIKNLHKGSKILKFFPKKTFFSKVTYIRKIILISTERASGKKQGGTV